MKSKCDLYICIYIIHANSRKEKRPRWMNDSKSTDPDKSARHIHSAAIDVFNKTVIMTCTLLFNRPNWLASQSPVVCSLSFFPLAPSCWKTTRLLQHIHTQRLASRYKLLNRRTERQTDRHENRKRYWLGNIHTFWYYGFFILTISLS